MQPTTSYSSEDHPHKSMTGIELPTTVVSRAIDRLIGWVGEFAAVLWPLLIIVILIQVFGRYVMGQGSIMFEEIQWHLYAMGFMLGLSLTEVRGRNIRIDVIAEKFPRKVRLIIELFGIVFLMLPFTVFVVYAGWPYFMSSYNLNEVSAAPSGLPFRWFIKSFIVTAFALLALVGIGRLTRVLVALKYSFWPQRAS